jgi:hypothetical protein
MRSAPTTTAEQSPQPRQALPPAPAHSPAPAHPPPVPDVVEPHPDTTPCGDRAPVSTASAPNTPSSQHSVVAALPALAQSQAPKANSPVVVSTTLEEGQPEAFPRAWPRSPSPASQAHAAHPFLEQPPLSELPTWLSSAVARFPGLQALIAEQVTAAPTMGTPFNSTRHDEADSGPLLPVSGAVATHNPEGGTEQCPHSVSGLRAAAVGMHAEEQECTRGHSPLPDRTSLYQPPAATETSSAVAAADEVAAVAAQMLSAAAAAAASHGLSFPAPTTTNSTPLAAACAPASTRADESTAGLAEGSVVTGVPVPTASSLTDAAAALSPVCAYILTLQQEVLVLRRAVAASSRTKVSSSQPPSATAGMTASTVHPALAPQPPAAAAHPHMPPEQAPRQQMGAGGKPAAVRDPLTPRSLNALPPQDYQFQPGPPAFAPSLPCPLPAALAAAATHVTCNVSGGNPNVPPNSTHSSFPAHGPAATPCSAAALASSHATCISPALECPYASAAAEASGILAKSQMAINSLQEVLAGGGPVALSPLSTHHPTGPLPSEEAVAAAALHAAAVHASAAMRGGVLRTAQRAQSMIAAERVGAARGHSNFRIASASSHAPSAPQSNAAPGSNGTQPPTVSVSTAETPSKQHTGSVPPSCLSPELAALVEHASTDDLEMLVPSEAAREPKSDTSCSPAAKYSGSSTFALVDTVQGASHSGIHVAAPRRGTKSAWTEVGEHEAAAHGVQVEGGASASVDSESEPAADNEPTAERRELDYAVGGIGHVDVPDCQRTQGDMLARGGSARGRHASGHGWSPLRRVDSRSDSKRSVDGEGMHVATCLTPHCNAGSSHNAGTETAAAMPAPAESTSAAALVAIPQTGDNLAHSALRSPVGRRTSQGVARLLLDADDDDDDDLLQSQLEAKYGVTEEMLAHASCVVSTQSLPRR